MEMIGWKDEKKYKIKTDDPVILESFAQEMDRTRYVPKEKKDKKKKGGNDE